jgi:hypothetical protein
MSLWLEQSEDQLLCRHAAYWLSLTDRPATTNTASITVALPRQQLLTADGLRGLMERASRREPL